MWDGVPGEEGGCGTASIVQVKLRNLARETAGEQLRRTYGAVVQIVTPREGSGSADAKAGEVIVHGDESISDRILRDTDNYNKDCMKNASDVAEDDKIRAVYAASDRLSIIYDIWDRRVLIGLSACATVLTMAFLLYDEAEWHWMILLCGAMVISLFAINIFTKLTRFNARYVEYRVMAEACRV